MKVEFNQKKAISTATLGVSAGVGALVSKGAMSIAPASFNSPIVKTVIGVMSLIGASTIQGQGTLETASKGALLGVGIQQTAEAAITFIKPNVMIGDNPTKAKKFIAGALAGVEDSNETFMLPAANMERRNSQPAAAMVQTGINVI